MPGGAEGALAAAPSPAGHLCPACTPACRQRPSQGCSCPEWYKSCSALLLQPGGTVAAWPSRGDHTVPTSSRIWALSLRFSLAAQLSGTLRPCTATAALCSGWQGSLSPCHPPLAHGCRGTGPTPLARAGTLPTHPVPGAKRVSPHTSRFALLSPQPRCASRLWLRCLRQRCQHPSDARRCRGMHHRPHSSLGSRAAAASRDPDAWSLSTSPMQ